MKCEVCGASTRINWGNASVVCCENCMNTNAAKTLIKESNRARSDLQTATSNVSEKGFFGKLANGDFGLAKTYWIYGVLAGIVVNIVLSVVTSIGALVFLMLAYIAYEIPVLMGTWRAANKYPGLKIWAILAQVAVVLGAIMLAVGLFAIIGLLVQA